MKPRILAWAAIVIWIIGAVPFLYLLISPGPTTHDEIQGAMNMLSALIAYGVWALAALVGLVVALLARRGGGGGRVAWIAIGLNGAVLAVVVIVVLINVVMTGRV